MDLKKYLGDIKAQVDAGGLQDVGLAIGILAVIGFVESLKLPLKAIWRCGIIYIVNEIYGIAAITTGSVFTLFRTTLLKITATLLHDKC